MRINDLVDRRTEYEREIDARLMTPRPNVSALNARIALLEKAVKAVDAYILVEKAMEQAAEEGTGHDLYLESMEYRDAYDAIRAKIGEIK